MTPASTPRQRRLAYIAWIAVCLIWGTTYFAIRISLDTIPPALVGGLRFTIAGGSLAAFLLLRGIPLPPASRWPSIALIGCLLLGLGNGGVIVAELWVPSGLTAVLVATSPFWMATLESFLPGGERLRALTVAGLLVGFGGIVLLVWPDLTLASPRRGGTIVGIIAAQIACAGWALGSSLSRRQQRNENVLATTALQMLAGGLIMTLAATIRGEWADLHFTTRTAAAMAYLATVGAIGGFVAYTYALRHLAVSFVSLYAYINPVIAVTLGVLLLAEPFNLRMALAAVLVFAGVTIVRWRTSSARPSVQTVGPLTVRPAGR